MRKVKEEENHDIINKDKSAGNLMKSAYFGFNCQNNVKKKEKISALEDEN